MITVTFTADGATKDEIEANAEAQILMFMGYTALSGNADVALNDVQYDISCVPLSQDKHTWRITQWRGEVTLRIP